MTIVGKALFGAILLLIAWPATAAPQAAAAARSELVLQAEVLLDREGFSPGVIDGTDGDNFGHALHAFQQANGLPVGPLDQATLNALGQKSPGEILASYTIQPADTAGPFVTHIPHDFAQMARLPNLGYRSPRQLLAERFHMSEGLLAALNPGLRFDRPGTVISVANVVPPSPDAAVSQGSGSSTAPAAALVVVDKEAHAVSVYSSDKRLLAFYPASIGSAEKPAPSGTFRIRGVAYNPTYTYNPAYAFRGQHAQRRITVRPGPNNPVGLVWIGLSLKGYGIHGSPDPDLVGKTQSHGCIRLTNWDALGLARLVKPGTPVVFVGGVVAQPTG